MQYDVAQTALETYVQTEWTYTAIAFDNVAFDSENYTEYLSCNVRFGDGRSRTVTQGCYRQLGLLILSIYTKPGIGSARKLELAKAAALLVTSKVVSPVAPLVRPKVKLLVPDLHVSDKEQNGWVQTQVSCPFYYDLEF